MVVYDPVFLGWKAADPWTHVAGATPCYSPDYELLVAPLTVAVRGGLVSETGVFPKGVDLWLSSELRRAGFSDEETWPRLTRPRVLPQDVALLLKALPVTLRGVKDFNLREEIRRRVTETAAVTPTDAKVLGRAYDKQVDVCISRLQGSIGSGSSALRSWCCRSSFLSEASRNDASQSERRSRQCLLAGELAIQDASAIPPSRSRPPGPVPPAPPRGRSGSSARRPTRRRDASGTVHTPMRFLRRPPRPFRRGCRLA